jgi:hypothetical protein
LDRPTATVPAALAALLCALVLACLATAPAEAAPNLGWSAVKVDGVGLTGVSCASSTLCVAVDKAGDAFLSTNPTAGAGATWSPHEIDGGTPLTGVSCATNALCVAVDGQGRVLIGTNPAAGAGWSRVENAGTPALTGVSCASTALCVAVDQAGEAFVSTNPTAGAGAGWSRATIDSGHALSSVSCASTVLCVAVDNAGRALVSHEPAGAPSTWHPNPIDLSPDLVSVSCAPAPAGLCVAVDSEGDALASGNPGGEAPTWSWTPAFALALGAPGAPTAVSCAAAGLCVSVDSGGGAYASDDPTSAPPTWTFGGIEPGRALAGVSCVPEGLCVAVNSAGEAFVTRVPPPTATTGAPTALSEVAANVSGTVNPDDATLTSCNFEYGQGTTYGQNAPCATPLPAGGATQAVTATLNGLTVGATYHYRLVASTASGTSVGADTTFKTLAPPLVQPHPSISGIPAVGQRLTCKSGVSGSGSASATVSYAWLRDTQAVAGATSSVYTVSTADVSHHLQCRVTATNAGGSQSATSSFVNVPAGGLGTISETQVGTPRVAGATVSVPLRCSAQAAGSCTITLRLTVVETLHGTHVVAVAAARARHATVTVAASTAHLKPSQQLTVNLTLNATGRRLLAHQRQMPVKLSVSGTVVGALSATLKSATLTLSRGGGRASSHKASTHHHG